MYSQVELPSKLNTPAFNEIWAEFRQHRKEIRHPLTPTSERRLFLKLIKYPVDVAIKMIEHSIECGYQGVFEIKEAPQKKTFDPPARRASTYHCPQCNTTHPIKDPCPTWEPGVHAIISQLSSQFTVPQPEPRKRQA